ncbi:hypothetical protein QTV44_000017 [Vibrio vulnificus]|nr:hypothetical protein [Vibrio vulnificus]
MKKPTRKSSKKIQKNNFEERFNVMVAEYQEAKSILDSLEQGTSEYAEQKKLCDKLFANAERYINRK